MSLQFIFWDVMPCSFYSVVMCVCVCVLSLGRPRHRWEDNIKMDLQEVGRGCRDWMELAQDRDRWRVLVSMVINFWFP